MRVSAFMTPKDKVYTCLESDPIAKALELILQHKISAVVVLGDAEGTKPAGVVTKTDLVNAWHKNVPLESKVSDIMAKTLETIRASASRDQISSSIMWLSWTMTGHLLGF
jgi:CBS domain-containing protein